MVSLTTPKESGPILFDRRTDINVKWWSRAGPDSGRHNCGISAVQQELLEFLCDQLPGGHVFDLRRSEMLNRRNLRFAK
jgi:hypothetical protein